VVTTASPTARLVAAVAAWQAAEIAAARAETAARAELAASLAAARADHGHSQESLALASGVARSGIIRAETGAGGLTLATAISLVRSLPEQPSAEPAPARCHRRLTVAQLRALIDSDAPEAERDRARHVLRCREARS